MLRQSTLFLQLNEDYRQASSGITLEITIQCKLQEQAGKLHHILQPKHTLLSNVLLQFYQTCNCYSSCQLGGPCRTHTIDHRVASLGCWAAITPEACRLSYTLCYCLAACDSCNCICIKLPAWLLQDGCVGHLLLQQC